MLDCTTVEHMFSVAFDNHQLPLGPAAGYCSDQGKGDRHYLQTVRHSELWSQRLFCQALWCHICRKIAPLLSHLHSWVPLCVITV